VRRFVRQALAKVPLYKERLPAPIFFTIVLLSTRWGRVPGTRQKYHEESDLALQPTPSGDTGVPMRVHMV